MTLKPTVIGTGQAPPAAPAEPPADAPKPTVIGAMPRAAVPVVEVAVPKATALPKSPMPLANQLTTATSATPSAATRLRGVERKGLDVDAADLRLRHLDATARALDHASALLGSVVPETHAVAAIERLGRASQEGVGRLVDRVLRLVDAETARTAGRHVERLLELLAELAEVLQPGGIGWRRKSLREALAHSRPEMDSLRGLLERSEASLVEQRDQLLAMHSELQSTLDGLNGVLIAIGELRPVFEDKRRANALDSRESDVAKSVALLVAHDVQMQRLESDFNQLAQRIRDAVLHALPAWLSMAASAPGQTLNETERFTLRDQLHALIHALSPRH